MQRYVHFKLSACITLVQPSAKKVTKLTLVRVYGNLVGAWPSGDPASIMEDAVYDCRHRYTINGVRIIDTFREHVDGLEQLVM
jgi:hypothetical protein